MTKFYVSDLHFYHENILKLDNRPFKSVAEMNQALIKNWNSVVKHNDDVYVVGDMFMRCTAEEALVILNQLNGRIHYVLGNHEFPLEDSKVRDHMVEIEDLLVVQDTDKTGKHWNITLTHYPLASYAGAYRKNTLHFYGHVHNSKEELNFQIEKLVQKHLNPNIHQEQSINIGVMMPYMNYRPQPLDDLLEEAYKQAQDLVDLSQKLDPEISRIRNEVLKLYAEKRD